MRSHKLSCLMAQAGIALLAMLLLPACSVKVDKDGSGEEKKVDIKTFAGGIHVSQDANPSETGLPVYPGAHLKADDSSDDKGASTNISAAADAIKVADLDYQPAQ